MRYFKILILFSIILILNNCARNSERKNGEIIFGVNPMSPPYSCIKNNELVGFDIDIGKLIGAELKTTVKFEQMQYSNLILALQSGFIDTFVSIMNDKRKKNFDFSRKYMYDPMVVIYKKNLIINNLEELKNKNIAVLLGSYQHEFAKQNLKENNIKVIDNIVLAVRELKLKNNSIDGVLIAKSVVKNFIINNDNLGYSVIENNVPIFTYAVRKGDKVLLNRLNYALDSLEKQGKIKELEAKWFG